MLIVDEFTGRTMPGRRWSEGLHQAVEAKEGVQVKGETQTLATITIQNYFRMYEKLAGMTGTAETEETEFHQIYKLEVVGHPDEPRRHPRRPARPRLQDAAREVQRDRRGDAAAARARLSRCSSARRASMCRRRCRACSSARGITHNVLNAKYHQREAEIVANAGQPGAVTIATNMAGRGTDIKLGAGVTESKPSHGEGSRRTRTIDVEEMRRPAHHRLRAARVAAHRPPAARPRRPPGRSGRVAVLPLARRRPDAPLRLASASRS